MSFPSTCDPVVRISNQVHGNGCNREGGMPSEVFWYGLKEVKRGTGVRKEFE